VYVSDATLRRAAWAMPVGYAGLGAASAALAIANGVLLGEDLALVLVFFLYTVVGTLVASRHPRNPVGWLLSSVGLFAAATFVSDQYAMYAALTPETLPGSGLAAWLSLWLWMGMLGPMLYTVLLFPSGHLPSRRWRPASWAAGMVLGIVAAIFALGAPASDASVPVANPFWIPALTPLYELAEASFILFVALFGMAVAGLVARFLRSHGVERQQLKWIVAAGVLMVTVLLIGILFPAGTEWAWILSVVTLPAAIGVAILRYRLYDIDLLINRTLVYGALSAALLATYVLSVLALSALLRPLTGSGDLAVAGSTLAVVAAFGPLRARLQRFVDRRFYRARYDAARTVDAFAARLRDQVDLDALSGELVGVVHDTVRPAHASLWLRGGRS